MIILDENLNERYVSFSDTVLHTKVLTEKEKLIIGIVVNLLKNDEKNLEALLSASKSRNIDSKQLASISALTQILWFESVNNIFDEEIEDDICCQ